jgi:hypothetical protein
MNSATYVPEADMLVSATDIGDGWYAKRRRRPHSQLRTFETRQMLPGPEAEAHFIAHQFC